MRRAAALLLLLSACAGGTKIPDEDRLRLERTIPGRSYYLRHSMYVGPFWGDPRRRFLSDVVPGEIPYVLSPSGDSIDPGPASAIVPAGTRVRVEKLELPTGFVVATRAPTSPRYHPWVSLRVDGLPAEPVPVLLLLGELRTREQVEAELLRYLSPDDLSVVLDALPEDQRRAVREKRVLPGMTADAVEMAWGYPERKTLSNTEQGRREDWVWPRGQRRATLLDGRLTEWRGDVPRLPVP